MSAIAVLEFGESFEEGVEYIDNGQFRPPFIQNRGHPFSQLSPSHRIDFFFPVFHGHAPANYYRQNRYGIELPIHSTPKEIVIPALKIESKNKLLGYS